MNNYSINSTLLSAGLSQNIADLRARIKETSSEAVTGRWSDLTQQLSGRIGDAMLSQKALNDLTDQRGLLSLRETRLDILQQSLSRVQDSAEGLSTHMLSGIGSNNTTDVNAAASGSKVALDTIFSSLNIRHGERYLFSGEATSTQPFGTTAGLLDDIRQIAQTATDAADFEAQIDTYFNDPTGGWQQGTFAGSANPTDADGVTGADPAITKLVSGLAVMAVSGETDNLALLRQNPGLVESAAIRTAEGQTAVTNLRADQGIQQQRIADEQSALDMEETILTEAFNKMTGRDQYEAASELRELESNLEASYLLTARLSNLSLTNYLR
ncbi:flagellin [Henriciella sp.]|uniref:flagellin n=1 Tax=Henriciella sp. TaxID=1968823 RepID=UPI00261C39AA|nr:flagellin [Henriciella sp.]